MNRTMKFLTLAAGLLGTSMAWAATQAGDLILVQGAVFVRDAAGVERPATLGMAVASGETLLTRDGRTQVKFSDGGMVSLQPETQFKITEYRFKDTAKSDDSAIFNLIKGGFRTITGLVGKKNTSAYRVETVTATIGIRGTEYQALLCISSCKEPDGLYVQTGEGTIFVKNAIGEIDVTRGQAAYVASPDTAPQRTTTAPAMTARAAVQSAPPSLPGIGTTTDFQPGNIIAANSLGAVTSVTGGGLALAAAGTLSGTGSSNLPGAVFSVSGQAAGAGSGAGSIDVLPAGALVGAYMNGGAVSGGVFSANGGVASAVFGTPPVNAGSNGDLYWGRWTGTTLTLYAGLSGYVANGNLTIPATSSIHYLLGTSTPTIPTTGTATYSFVGGTPSTDMAGVVGSGITSGSLTANFSSNYVSGNFNVSHGSNYAVSATMPMGTNNRASFGTDHGGSATANGSITGVQVNGFFVGSGAPTGAGISYLIPVSGNSIVGVGAFR